MLQHSRTYGSWVLLPLLVACLFLTAGSAEGRNPDLSYWTLNLSESAAPTELGEADFNQEIAVVGSTVHVMWFTHDKDVWARYKIFYRRSTDNGQTWEAKQLLFTNDDLVTDVTYKRMVVTGNTVHIALDYYGGEGGSWYGVLGYLRSTNNGASFEAIRNLFTASIAWHVYDVRVAASNGKVTIGFRNQANGVADNQYYILNSDDGGDTFTQRTAYSTTTGSGWLVSDLQRVGDNIYVLYTDSYFFYGLQYSNLYLAASANAGVNFTSTLISVPSSNGNHKTGTLQDNHYVPKIAGVGNNVSVIWSGLDANDVLSVFYRQSTNSGSAFGNAQNLSNGVIPAGKAIEQGQETLAAQGSYVYSLFLSTASNVYFRRSLDSGAGFQGLQELTAAASTPYIAGGWWPVMATDPTDASGATVHVLWDWPAYCCSRNGGATFTKPDLVTPYFSYGGSLTSGANRPYMTIGPDGKVHLVVEARYNANSFGGYGDFDIFYRGFGPAPGPSGANNGLHLFSNRDDARYDNMQVPASSYLNFTTQMTGEVWVRPSPGGNTTGTTSGIQPIFHKLEASYHFAYALETWGTYGGGQRKAAAELTTTNGIFWLNSSTLVPDNTWSHLAFTYDAAGGANNFKLYLNGQLIATTTATGNLATGDGLFFTGYYGIWDVAELQLWNRVLSQGELAANMYRARTGSEAGLNAYYTFKNTTRDITGHGNDGILMYMEQYMQQNVLRSNNEGALSLLLLMD
ncbi:MAG: hypothetical protein NTY36_01995 [Deltaproteobacteria bacterium]|nr:hypothetical protein [Deltaproteobacteria bacterium]